MALAKSFPRWALAGALLLAATPAFAADSAAPATKGLVLPTWVFASFDFLVLGLSALASIAGIALAIDAMIHIREGKIAPAKTTAHLRALIDNRQYQDLLDFTATDKTFVSQALHAAIKRAHLKYPVMHEALETSISDQTSNWFRRIEPMNVIGNIGPLLGLLGTVLGMIMAFYSLMQEGGATATPASKLAGGISTALWHTFFGLLVAIPCLVIYGFYRTKVDSITTHAAGVAEELLESLRPAPGEEELMRKRKPARESAIQSEREPVAETQAAPE